MMYVAYFRSQRFEGHVVCWFCMEFLAKCQNAGVTELESQVSALAKSNTVAFCCSMCLRELSIEWPRCYGDLGPVLVPQKQADCMRRLCC